MKKYVKSLIIILPIMGMALCYCAKCGSDHSHTIDCNDEIILYGGKWKNNIWEG